MSKRRKWKTADTECERTVVERIEAARVESISQLGIGGYIDAVDFCSIYNEMDADLFAEIMYATEYMFMDDDGADAVNPINIPVTIQRYDFQDKPHFNQVAEVFRQHVGSERVRLSDVDEQTRF